MEINIVNSLREKVEKVDSNNYIVKSGKNINATVTYKKKGGHDIAIIKGKGSIKFRSLILSLIESYVIEQMTLEADKENIVNLFEKIESKGRYRFEKLEVTKKEIITIIYDGDIRLGVYHFNMNYELVKAPKLRAGADKEKNIAIKELTTKWIKNFGKAYDIEIDLIKECESYNENLEYEVIEKDENLSYVIGVDNYKFDGQPRSQVYHFYIIDTFYKNILYKAHCNMSKKFLENNLENLKIVFKYYLEKKYFIVLDSFFTSRDELAIGILARRINLKISIAEKLAKNRIKQNTRISLENKLMNLCKEKGIFLAKTYNKILLVRSKKDNNKLLKKQKNLDFIYQLINKYKTINDLEIIKDTNYYEYDSLDKCIRKLTTLINFLSNYGNERILVG